MTSNASAQRAAGKDRQLHIGAAGRDRRLYIAAAVFIPIIVLIGFARSYYLKGFFGNPPLPSVLVHVHGIVMTSWVILFVTQVTLVAARRTRVHRRLGVLGAVLAATLVSVGSATAISSAARNVSLARAAPDGSHPGLGALRFLVIPLFDMAIFAILAGTALYFRRHMDLHKRLMLLATLSVLSAAIARIPLHFIATGGPLVFLGLTDLCIVGCVLYDTVKNRRLHPAFLWGTLLVIASQPLRIMLGGTDAWLKFSQWLIS